MFAVYMLAVSLALNQSGAGTGALPCTGDWVPGFGATPGVEGPVNAVLDLDGDTLVGGVFASAGGVPVSNVARFDGQQWHPLGLGLGAEVRALAVFGAPGNQRVLAGGIAAALPGSTGPFSSVAEFNGEQWVASAGGFGGVTVDFELRTIGSTEDLLALNHVIPSLGVNVWRVGTYNGSNWQSVSPLRPGIPQRIVVNDDGSGPRIYVTGGNLVGADGVPRNMVVWDGAAWQATAPNAPLGAITAITSFDWGQGPRLTAVGVMPGVTPATLGLGRLEGNQWIYTPIAPQSSPTALVAGLAPAQLQPGGPVELFGMGSLPLGGPNPSAVFRWDNGAFVSVLNGAGAPGTVQNQRTLERGIGAGGDRLLVGGFAIDYVGPSVRNVASISAQGVDALGEGLRGPIFDTAQRMTANGPELYVVGGPLAIGSTPLGQVARYVDGEWQSQAALGAASGLYERLLVDTESPTSDVYAAGQVVGRFDGTAWTQLGGSFGIQRVSALEFFEPQGGTRQLFMGLRPFAPTLVLSPYLQRFDGAVWQPVFAGANGAVNALRVFDEGSGPALYVGGDFTQIDGQSARYLVRYDGTSWTEVGANLGGPVRSIAIYDSGSGPRLHVAGAFVVADGAVVNGVARLDGASWSGLAGGVEGDVRTLSVHASPAGPLLIAAGVFLPPGGQVATGLAHWNGEQWTMVPEPISGGWIATARSYVWPGDLQPTLHLGGAFTALGPNGDSYFTRWGCPEQSSLVNPIASCEPSAVGLSSSASFVPLGGDLPLFVSGGSGVALVMLGFEFQGGGGCGLALPGIGELWLDPAQAIIPVAIGPLTLGSFDAALTVPSTPGLLGAEVALQAAALDGVGTTLSNALSVVLGP